MTPNLIVLYAASIACIALLAAFARHNRKTGWVKQRSSVMAEIVALHRSWEEMDHEEEVRRESASFSEQLANLQSALQERAVGVPGHAIQ